MLIVGLDIETTGLKVQDGHKVIEIGLAMHDLKTGEKVKELDMRFNPRRSIDAKAQATHGISLDMLSGCPLFEDEAQSIIDEFIKPASLIVAHNGDGFDIPFLKHELSEYGISLPEIPTLDTMLEGLWACEDGKRPRLEELAFALGFVYDIKRAHGAMYDVDLMMQCFFKAREKYNLFQTPFLENQSVAA